MISLLIRVGDADIVCKTPSQLNKLVAEFTVSSIVPQMNIHKIYGKCGLAYNYQCHRNMRVNDRAAEIGYCRLLGSCDCKMKLK